MLRVLATFRSFRITRNRNLDVGRKISLSAMAIDAQTVDTTARLASLRALMKDQDRNVQAFVVPSEDEREQ